jgi:two-component system, NarL family, capsular synthesis sensor histidine kinase RcsC
MGDLTGPTVKAENTASLEKRILVVDDEPVLRFMISTMLRENKSKYVYSIDTADNGKNACGAIESYMPSAYDLVISDINMPEMNGFQLTRYIREKGLNTKIILISGYTTKKDIKMVLPGDVSAFLSKPFSLQSLLDTVYDAISSDNR